MCIRDRPDTLTTSQGYSRTVLVYGAKYYIALEYKMCIRDRFNAIGFAMLPHSMPQVLPKSRWLMRRATNAIMTTGIKAVSYTHLQKITDWEDTDYAVGCITVFCGEVRLIDNIKYKG